MDWVIGAVNEEYGHSDPPETERKLELGPSQ
jgi:hypothetical protein